MVDQESHKSFVGSRFFQMFGYPKIRRWQLVWCNDPCFTDPCRKEYMALCKAAQPAGGSVMCIKSASRFREVQLDSSAPYVFLTDWHEAKAIMDTDFLCRVKQQPLFIMVMSQGNKQHKEVVSWAQAHAGTRAPIHVHKEVHGSPELVVARLIVHLQCSSANTVLPEPTQIPSAEAWSPQAALSLQVPWPYSEDGHTSFEGGTGTMLSSATSQWHECRSRQAPEGDAFQFPACGQRQAPEVNAFQFPACGQRQAPERNAFHFPACAQRQAPEGNAFQFSACGQIHEPIYGIWRMSV